MSEERKGPENESEELSPREIHSKADPTLLDNPYFQAVVSQAANSTEARKAFAYALWPPEIETQARYLAALRHRCTKEYWDDLCQSKTRPAQGCFAYHKSTGPLGKKPVLVSTGFKIGNCSSNTETSYPSLLKEYVFTGTSGSEGPVYASFDYLGDVNCCAHIVTEEEVWNLLRNPSNLTTTTTVDASEDSKIWAALLRMRLPGPSGRYLTLLAWIGPEVKVLTCSAQLDLNGIPELYKFALISKRGQACDEEIRIKLQQVIGPGLPKHSRFDIGRATYQQRYTLGKTFGHTIKEYETGYMIDHNLLLWPDQLLTSGEGSYTKTYHSYGSRTNPDVLLNDFGTEAWVATELEIAKEHQLFLSANHKPVPLERLASESLLANPPELLRDLLVYEQMHTG